MMILDEFERQKCEVVWRREHKVRNEKAELTNEIFQEARNLNFDNL